MTKAGRRTFVIEIIGVFFKYFAPLTHFYQPEEYIWQEFL